MSNTPQHLSIGLKTVAILGFICFLAACTGTHRPARPTTESTLPSPQSAITNISPEKSEAAPEKTPVAFQNPAIIFDLDGVLFSISKKRAISKLGFFDVLSYTMSGKKVEALEHVIFDILDTLEPQGPMPADSLVPMHGGRPLPKIMCNWLRGLISSEQVIDRVIPYIDKLYQENYFYNKTEKKLVIKIIKIMFDPKTRTYLYKPLKKGICLLKSCKKQGYPIYLLTNMDSELVHLLKEEHPDIFGLFNDIVVSADIKMIKPEKSIYTYLLKKYNLKASDCILIDDQKENARGARSIGMHAIVHNKNKVKKSYRKLIKAGLLPAQSIETCRVHG